MVMPRLAKAREPKGYTGSSPVSSAKGRQADGWRLHWS